MKYSKSLGLLAVLALSSGMAMAAPVTGTLDWDGFTHGSVTGDVKYTGTTYSDVQAGQFDVKYAGTDYAAFCIELTQYTGGSATYSYTSNATGALGKTTYARLDQLFGYVMAHGGVDDAQTSAAVQLAIWELMYEPHASSLSTGDLQAMGGFGSSVRNEAASWLTGSDGFTTSYQANVFHNASYQDFVTFTTPLTVPSAVPEPATWALVLAGLGSIAFIGRRKMVVAK